MYCSSSVSVHLLRGAAAIALLVASVLLSSYGLVWSAMAAIGAVVLLRGCPICWLIGLFETLKNRRNEV